MRPSLVMTEKNNVKLDDEKSEHKEQKNQKREYRNNYFPVYDSNSISYQEFVQCHLLKNEPCIIKNTVHNKERNETWSIYDKWLTNNKTDINLEYISNKYGNIKVEPAICGQLYGDEDRASMPLSKYLKILQKSNEKTNKNKDLNKWLKNVLKYQVSQFNPKWTKNILYCKDWHIVNDINDNLYQTPKYFNDDWLNYSCDQKQGQNKNINGSTNCKNKHDYRFCYLGPKYSWTALHHDVYSSYSWSSNILGKKLWIVFNPNESKKYLYHKNMNKNECIGHLLELIGMYNKNKLNKFGFPHLNELFDNNCQILNSKLIIQNENESIFIPSMWYHEVYNLSEIVLSINHNWFNAFNINYIWKCLFNEYEKILKLPKNSNNNVSLFNVLGIDFDQFIDILKINAQYILPQLFEYDKIIKFLITPDENDETDECDSTIDDDVIIDVVNNETYFRMKCYLFSMKNTKNLLNVIKEKQCIKNDKTMSRLRRIEKNIQIVLNGLQFIRIKDENWKTN